MITIENVVAEFAALNIEVTEPVLEDALLDVYDAEGNLVLDDGGDPVQATQIDDLTGENIQQPATDDDGNILEQAVDPVEYEALEEDTPSYNLAVAIVNALQTDAQG